MRSKNIVFLFLPIDLVACMGQKKRACCSTRKRTHFFFLNKRKPHRTHFSAINIVSGYIKVKINEFTAIFSIETMTKSFFFFIFIVDSPRMYQSSYFKKKKKIDHNTHTYTAALYWASFCVCGLNLESNLSSEMLNF